VLILIVLMATFIPLLSSTNDSQQQPERRSMNGDNTQEKPEEGFLAETYLWVRRISVGVASLSWVLVLEMMSICYNFDYQQTIDNPVTKEGIQLSSELREDIPGPQSVSAFTIPNISKVDDTGTPEGFVWVLPLEPAPMIFSAYYLTTITA